MYNLVPILSTILPVVATALLTTVITVNVVSQLRRKFPISVNCWFCNSWTKVPYDDRNSFNCPSCSQYNGFTKDGDYNRVIPEQHDEFMNHKSPQIKPRNAIISNGLCLLCNNNQQLKVYQLAHFVPLSEDNYDVEIEHFQEQLEKAYKLCKKCDKVLKTSISKQNAQIFGSRVKSMCSNGVSKIANQIIKRESKLRHLKTASGLLTLIFVIAVILTTVAGIKGVTRYLSIHIPTSYSKLFERIISFLNASKVVKIDFLMPYFNKNIKIDNYSTICGISLCFEGIKLILNKTITTYKLNHILCWIILFLVSWIRHTKNYSSYFLFIQGFTCLYLLVTAFTYYSPPKESQKPSGRKMRKLVKNLENTCTDYTDTISDFENLSNFSQNDSSRDSDSLNKSSYSPLSVPHNKSFTANSVLNSSFVSSRTHLETDLNKSLNNLHLGGLSSPRSAFSVASYPIQRPKPVLSPPRLQSVNSWVAGGFWRENEGLYATSTQRANLSRSSSESSGFGSQYHENVQFGRPRSTFLGDFDKLSVGSDQARTCYSPNYSVGQRMGNPGLFKLGQPSQSIMGPNWSDNVNYGTTLSFKDMSN